MTTETVEYQGKEYLFTLHADDYQPCPWVEFDGHGEVSEWTTRAKKPGEIVLCEDGRSKRYYDFQESSKIAKRDGWGVKDPEGMTRNQIAQLAVKADFEYLRSWCAGEWSFKVLTVTDPRTGDCEHLGGIEYHHFDQNNHIVDYALELAAELREREVWAA